MNDSTRVSTSPRDGHGNREKLQEAYERAAEGDPRAFVALFAEDVTWFTIGSTRWSGTFAGVSEVRAMFQRLYALLEERIVVTIDRIITEGDLVVVEGRGRSTTRAGLPYHNTYCFVHRFADGKLKEVREYCDTALIEATL